MKRIFRDTAHLLAWTLTSMILCFGAVPRSHAQDTKQDLHKQIATMEKILKSELKDNPRASDSLGLMSQLKIGIDDSNPDSIAALERGLVRHYDNKHQGEILQIIRTAAKQVEQENGNLQKAWNKQIADFVQTVKAACLKDVSLEELNKLLLQVDTLKSSQPKGRRTLTGMEKIEREKLDSAVKLLGKWTEYKRYATSGYEKKASEIIRSLQKSRFNYPILEKSFLDKIYAEAERARATAFIAKATKKTVSSYEAELKRLVVGLEKNKLDSQGVLKIAKQLETISAMETDDKKIDYRSQINGSLRDLGDCLYYADKNDLVKARILLLGFVEATYNFKNLQSIREKATTQLLPSLYAELGAQPLAPDQSLTRYLFKLASAPESLDRIALRNSYMHFYSEFYEYKYRPEWVKAAEDQFQSLARAASAMNCQDYPTALLHFRAALSYATESGPANAEKLIHAQINVIRKRQPSLFDPALADNLVKMEALDRRINYYKKKLKDVSKKK